MDEISNSEEMAEEPHMPSSPVCTDDMEDKIKEPLSIDTSETETVSIDGDRLSIKSGTSTASTPSKMSSGHSTPSGKRSLSPPVATPKLTPGGLGSKLSKGEFTPRTSRGTGRPHRHGITWKINAKLEAKDFQEKWYSARIVDMDDKDHTVLIHFDGWNSRFDEWVDMNSDRLRMMIRHSGRKEKKSSAPAKTVVKLEHKLGDNVFAKWTDCRMYAGTVVTVNSNGSYEVLFYDGFKKTVQPINVKAMSLAVQKEYAVAGILPDPQKIVKQKMKMIENLDKSATAKRGVGTSNNMARKTEDDNNPGSTKTSPVAATSQLKEAFSVSKKPPATPGSEEKKKGPSTKGVSPQETKKVVQASATKTKDSGSVVAGTGKPKFKHTSVKTQRPKKVKQKEAPSHSLAGATSQPGGSTEDLKIGSSEISGSVEFNEADMERRLHEPLAELESSDDEMVLAHISKQRLSASSSDLPTAAKVAKKPRPITSEGSVPCVAPSGVMNAQPKNAFKVEEEHNKFKCPFQDCNKSFRKLSLVEYHVKYYHTEDHKPILEPLSRKRKKTLSVCSSDSEVSTSGRASVSKVSQPAKRRRGESATPLPVTSEATVDTSLVSEDFMMQELSEVETHTTTTEEPDHKEPPSPAPPQNIPEVDMDCLNKDEVVNCICQINEENGLMIQCDVCLCWQHALCMEITEETLPSKYICYVCTNPPGVRDSMRYNYDQDWLKQGVMSSFSFVPEDPYSSQKAQIMQATHSLVADIHGVKNMLKSLNCQIEVLKDKRHPEVKLWTKNWDQKDCQPTKKRPSTSKTPLEHSTLTTVKEETSEIKQEIVEIKQEIGETDTEVKTEPGVTENIQEIKSEPYVDESDPKTPQSSAKEPQSSTEQEKVTLAKDASSSSLSSLRSGLSEEDVQPSTSGAVPSHIRSQEPPDCPKAVPELIQEAGSQLDECEQNLLQHISSTQEDVESRLDLIEEQITALESADDNGTNSSGGDILKDMPRVKKTVHQLLYDLVKVKRMALFH